jgi:hypothetical protein
MLPLRSSVLSSERSTSADTTSKTVSAGSICPRGDDPPSTPRRGASSAGGISSGSTASAASSVAPPANTASRRNATCSASLSRSWLHSIAACSVRCRGRPVRLPPDSNRNLSSSLAASCRTVSALSLAAASSSASGMPSRRRQISRTAPALPASSENPGRASPARSQNSRTDSASAMASGSSSAGGGTVSGSTGQVASPATFSLVWLVARTRSAGQLRSSPPTRSAAAGPRHRPRASRSRAAATSGRRAARSSRAAETSWANRSASSSLRPSVMRYPGGCVITAAEPSPSARRSREM